MFLIVMTSPIQVTDKPAKKTALDTNEEEAMTNTAKNRNLSYSEHEVTELRIQMEAGKRRSKIRTLDFNEADF